MSPLLGTNCYFLQEEGARECLGWEGYAGRVDEALRKVSELGLGLVRAWACHDDPDNPATLQRAVGSYSEAGLGGVDLALERARAHGVRLALSLGNYWGDYGGVPQYLRWHGLDPKAPWRFFTDACVQDHFARHLATVLSRVNPRTDLAWGEDDTVLCWELLNEPRGVGLASPDPFLHWVERMSQVVRDHASQPVCTGEEGLGDDGGLPSWTEAGGAWLHRDTGQDFSASAHRADIASAHLYPEHWGWSGDWAAQGAAWITDRAARAAAVGRPLLFGEFGLANHGLPLVERRAILDHWVRTALAQPNVLGICSWSFSTDDRPDAWDAFTWSWRDGTDPSDPRNRLADLHRDWARLTSSVRTA